jgi:hypothetical protein
VQITALDAVEAAVTLPTARTVIEYAVPFARFAVPAALTVVTVPVVAPAVPGTSI